jgi:uncharacterized protein YukE
LAVPLDGADLAQLDDLTRRFAAWAGQVQSLKTEITGVVNATVGVAWTGLVAARFRDEWNGEFAASLVRLADALEHQSQFVAAKRDQIDLVTNRL